MKRRNFFLAGSTGLLASFGLNTVLRAHQVVRDASNLTKGNFIHVVYFWLKEPEDREKNKAFLKSLTGFLSKVEVIVESFVGKPAMTPRDVVDNTYSYSLILTFNNKEDQDVYQAHAAHKKFIEESENLWSKVQVYDSIRI